MMIILQNIFSTLSKISFIFYVLLFTFFSWLIYLLLIPIFPEDFPSAENNKVKFVTAPKDLELFQVFINIWKKSHGQIKKISSKSQGSYHINLSFLDEEKFLKILKLFRKNIDGELFYTPKSTGAVVIVKKDDKIKIEIELNFQ